MASGSLRREASRRCAVTVIDIMRLGVQHAATLSSSRLEKRCDDERKEVVRRVEVWTVEQGLLYHEHNL